MHTTADTLKKRIISGWYAACDPGLEARIRAGEMTDKDEEFLERTAIAMNSAEAVLGGFPAHSNPDPLYTGDQNLQQQGEGMFGRSETKYYHEFLLQAMSAGADMTHWIQEEANRIRNAVYVNQEGEGVGNETV